MNHRLLFCLALLPAVSLAQEYQGMSQQDMQRMMQGAQQMQTCMQNVDQGELEAFGRRAKAVEQEVRSLCANGQRDEAQARGMAFAVEAQQNTSMQQMSKCGQMMASAVPTSPFLEQLKNSGSDGGSQHICD